MEKLDFSSISDLRHLNSYDHANFLLQKTWPGVVGPTATWPGLSALLVIVRHIYSFMPSYLRIHPKYINQEQINPILKLAWMDVSGQLASDQLTSGQLMQAYSKLWEMMQHALCPDPTENPPTLLQLLNSKIMTDTLWSRSEFQLYRPEIFTMPSAAGEDGQWERRGSFSTEELAQNSVVKYDGSKELSEVVADMFGTFEVESLNVLRLFNLPIYMIVLYNPISDGQVQTTRFKSLQKLQFEAQEWNRQSNVEYQLVSKPQSYTLIATARLRPDTHASDHVRLYSIRGGYIFPPESLQDSPILSSHWQVGIPGQSYLLIYARTSVHFNIPLDQIKEVEHIDARVKEYQQRIDSLSNFVVLDSSEDTNTNPSPAIDTRSQ